MRKIETGFREVMVTTIIGGSAATGIAIWADSNDYWQGSNNSDHELRIPTSTSENNSGISTSTELGWGYEEYKYKGTQFRHRIKVLMEENPEEGKKLQEKYNFLFKVTERREYLDGGEDFSPQLGDFFYIDDPSKKKPGVILREGLTADINIETDSIAVFDGDIIKIIGEAEDAIGYDHEANQEISKKVYRVSVVFQNSQLGPDFGETGYIPMDYLGSKHDLKPPAGR